jgi:hypothetical protein
MLHEESDIIYDGLFLDSGFSHESVTNIYWTLRRKTISCCNAQIAQRTQNDKTSSLNTSTLLYLACTFVL